MSTATRFSGRESDSVIVGCFGFQEYLRRPWPTDTQPVLQHPRRNRGAPIGTTLGSIGPKIVRTSTETVESSLASQDQIR